MLPPQSALRRHSARLGLVITVLALLLLGGTRFARQVGAGKKPPAATAAPAAPPALPSDPAAAEGGKWSPVVNTADVPVHISVLPDGKVFYWGRDKEGSGPNHYDVEKKSNVYLWDPLYTKDDEVSLTARKDNTTTNLFCSGHSFLPDGKLLVTGGHAKLSGYPSVEGVGEKHINIYDYRKGQWADLATLPKMEKGRWYPYNVTLKDGETIIISGSYHNGEFDPDGLPQTVNNTDHTIFDLQGGIRTLYGNSHLANYPYASLLPDGNVYVAGPKFNGWTSWIIEPYFNNDGFIGRMTPANPQPTHPHNEGTSVMYAPGKVLLLGGRDMFNVTTKVAIYHPSPGVGGWQSAGTMANARQYPTATVLPDGKVLVTGGTSCSGTNRLDCSPGGAVHTPEMWNPANPTVWRQMTPTTSGIPRVYHSIALLMPDGRVLVGGGGLPAAQGEKVGTTTCKGDGPDDYPECRNFGHKTVEFYSPPYLFDANGNPAVRPAITSAPPSVAYGQQFKVGVGNLKASQLKDKAVLIRLPSVTHTYNQDQRRVELSLTGTADDERSVTLTAPPHGGIAPPGPYMLFLLSNDDRNTPSVAKIVRVGHLSLDSDSRAFYPENYAAQGSPSDLNGTIEVSVAPGLSWTAAPEPTASPWVQITSGASGTGSGQIKYSVSPNAGAAARSGKIQISVKMKNYANQEVTMPNAAHEFTVQQAGIFADVTTQTLLHREISKIFAKGVTTGCGGGNYCPSSPVTRAQMAIFLSKALGVMDPPTPPTPTFWDVHNDGGQGAYKFIEFIARRGISLGYGDNSYQPDRAVTRAEMAVFILRSLGVTHPQPPPPDPSDPNKTTFTDVPRGHWAFAFIEEAYRRGIAGGYGNGRFGPDDPVTREQMAKFLSNGFGY